MRVMIGFAVAATAIAACAESQHYVYTPETANAALANTPASRTPIPQEAPQGAVEVATYGIAHLRQDDASVPALHVRMIVSNDGDAAPWQVDTRDQYVSIAGEGRSRAIYVNSDVQTLPIVQIAQHERHVFDLYFPLPATVRGASQLPRFDVQWQVATDSRVVASSTAFDRMAEEPASGYAYVEPGWPYWGYGPYGWYDPLYPQVVFVHSRPFRGHGHGPVVAGRVRPHR